MGNPEESGEATGEFVGSASVVIVERPETKALGLFIVGRSETNRSGGKLLQAGNGQIGLSFCGLNGSYAWSGGRAIHPYRG